MYWGYIGVILGIIEKKMDTASFGKFCIDGIRSSSCQPSLSGGPVDILVHEACSRLRNYRATAFLPHGEAPPVMAAANQLVR